MNKKWFAPILPYFSVWAGLFLFKSAWLALIGFHLSILLALFVLRSDVPVAILFKSKYPKWVTASVVLCGISGINLYFFWNMFGIANDLPAQIESIGLNSSSWFPFIAYFSLINPFVEEYFWRGFLASNTKNIHAGDFIFAGYHALILWGKIQPLSILFAFVFLATAGWFWRQIRREDDGLLASALGHLAADFSILVCIYLRTTPIGL
jgi:membrane protease YdiL (CAAX protease family)